MSELGPVLVVDLGTSSSRAVVVDGGEVTAVREPNAASLAWPSAAARAGEGTDLVVGSVAERRKRAEPARYIAEFKRLLGQDVPVDLDGVGVLPQDLAAAMLARLREEALKVHGGPVDRLVVTVPASYGEGDLRRDLVISAGERVGFSWVETLPEPVAAASSPLAGDGFGPGDLALVYDFGGGTFDAALVRFAGSAGDPQLEVLGHAAVDSCGGRDIDDLIAAYLRDRAGPELGAVFANRADGPGRAARLRLGLRLRDLARDAKHQLSEQPEIEVQLGTLHQAALPCPMSQDILAAMITPLIEQTLDCCRALLRAHDMKEDDLDGVLLAGGTTRIPLVATLVGERLGHVVRARDPELAVLYGAAAHVQKMGPRLLPPVPLAPGETPLRWAIPGESATLRTWLVEPGQEHSPRQPLALIRDSGTRLWHLLAPDAPGTLTTHHADPGTAVRAGQWLATTQLAAARD